MARRPGLPPAEQIDRAPLPPVNLARDYQRADVHRMIRTAEWAKVRPGAYVRTALVASAQDPSRFLALARIAAVTQQLSVPHAVSHESAAVLWGLPTLTVPDRTHVIQRSWPAGERASDVARHSHRLGVDEATAHRGTRVTTLERTAVDCAMSLGCLAGLVIADACLHNGADRDRCLETLAAMAGRRGAPQARAILALADDGAESPGETRTRFVLLRAGLPAPDTQVHVVTPLGGFWSDIGWPQWRLLIEYDGRAKYDAAERASDVVVRERRRQRAVEEAGWRLIRVTTEDLRNPSALVQRVARHLPPRVLATLAPRRSLGSPC